MDQPRYGPNGDAVATLIARLRELDAAGVATLARTGARAQARGRSVAAGHSPDDDEALRVSSTLAARDAAAAIPPAAGRRACRPGTAGRGASRPPAGPAPCVRPGDFDGADAPWRPGVLPDGPARSSVRRPSSA